MKNIQPTPAKKKTPPPLDGLSTGQGWYHRESQDGEGWEAGTRAFGDSFSSQLISGKLAEPSLWETELPAQIPLSFREKGCFEVILPRAGLSQAQWHLWHKEQNREMAAGQMDGWTVTQEPRVLSPLDSCPAHRVLAATPGCPTLGPKAGGRVKDSLSMAK